MTSHASGEQLCLEFKISESASPKLINHDFHCDHFLPTITIVATQQQKLQKCVQPAPTFKMSTMLAFAIQKAMFRMTNHHLRQCVAITLLLHFLERNQDHPFAKHHSKCLVP